jgi:hypothetical protein
MSDENNPARIQAFVFGASSEAEQRELMRRALDDQTIFDELWDAADDHELLRDPITRNRLLRALRDREQEPWWGAAWAWLRLPASRFALVGAVVLAVAVFIWWGPNNARREVGEIKPATIVTDSGTDLSKFFTLPLRNNLAVTFDLNRAPATFHIGEVIRATLQLPQPTAVFILRRQSDGKTRIVFPADLSTTADVNAGALTAAFDPIPPTSEVGVRERVTLRIIALPTGRDLRTQSIEWAKLGAYSVQELTYDVVR